MDILLSLKLQSKMMENSHTISLYWLVQAAFGKALHERDEFRKEVTGLEHFKIQFSSQESYFIEIVVFPNFHRAIIYLTLRTNTVYLKSTSQTSLAALFLSQVYSYWVVEGQRLDVWRKEKINAAVSQPFRRSFLSEWVRVCLCSP